MTRLCSHSLSEAEICWIVTWTVLAIYHLLGGGG